MKYILYVLICANGLCTDLAKIPFGGPYDSLEECFMTGRDLLSNAINEMEKRSLVIADTKIICLVSRRKAKESSA